MALFESFLGEVFPAALADFPLCTVPKVGMACWEQIDYSITLCELLRCKVEKETCSPAIYYYIFIKTELSVGLFFKMFGITLKIKPRSWKM